MDSHWRPQTNQLFQGLVTLDFIGYFENLEHDLQQIVYKILSNSKDKCGLADEAIYSLKYKGRKTNSNQRIDEFYDPSIQELVKNIYQHDFDNFGYSDSNLKLLMPKL